MYLSAAEEGDDILDNCDVPLMLFLLKQEFKISDDKLPSPSSVSKNADITRINYYTQFIVNRKSTRSLEDTDFKDIWDTVVEVN